MTAATVAMRMLSVRVFPPTQSTRTSEVRASQRQVVELDEKQVSWPLKAYVVTRREPNPEGMVDGGGMDESYCGENRTHRVTWDLFHEKSAWFCQALRGIGIYVVFSLSTPPEQQGNPSKPIDLIGNEKPIPTHSFISSRQSTHVRNHEVSTNVYHEYWFWS